MLQPARRASARWESTELLGAVTSQPRFRFELQRVGTPEPKLQVHDVDRRR